MLRSIKKTVLLLVSILLFSPMFHACDLDNPNPPVDPGNEIKNMLPLTQRFVAFLQASDFSRFSAIWMQQIASGRYNSIPEMVDKYNVQANFFDEAWEFYYVQTYLNLYSLMGYAEEISADAVSGIVLVLQAYTFGLMTDSWGDIPRSQAHFYFAGTGRPEYDSQQEVYTDIISMLDQAIGKLEQAKQTETFELQPESDPIYGANINQWLRAANLIKLRHLMRLAHYEDDYTSLLGQMQSMDLMTSNQDNMLFNFDGSVNQTNPIFSYDQNQRHTRIGKFLVDLLLETDDPRLPRMVKLNVDNEYKGSAPGQSLHTASYIGPALASPDSPVLFATYAEQKFIEAEIYYRASQQSMADAAYAAGVRASLEFFNVSDPEWEAENADKTDVSLEDIITAKYLALFLQPEVWSDYRRTGFPNLTPFDPNAPYQEKDDNGDDNGDEETEPQIPRRYVYPQREINNNSDNMPAGVTIFSRVWWDRE